MSEFSFDPVDHSYFLGSVRLPSVTQILEDVGLIDPRFFTDEARDRGSRVHRGCELLAQNNLDWESVEPVDVGYLRSLEKLLEYTGWIAGLTEERRYDSQLKFAGTYDVNFTCGTLGDLKSGAPAKWHRIQLGFYWRLNGETGKVCGIYLQEDGSTAKLKFYNGLECWREAQVCLNFYNLRRAIE